MSKSTQTTKGRNRHAMPDAAAQPTKEIPSFDTLPDSAWVRQADLVRDHNHPTRPVPLPISGATFWRWIHQGKFIPPSRLGPRVTAWKVGDVRQWLKAQTSE